MRRDLRLADNPAALAACEHAGSAAIYPLFVVDSNIAGASGPNRARFLRATLEELATRLPLTVREGDPLEVVRAFARQHGVREVVATTDHGVYGRRRDAAVRDALADDGVTLTLVDSHYVCAPGTIRTQTGSPYRVFTPYLRGWKLQPLVAPRGDAEGNFQADESISLARLEELAGNAMPSYFDADVVTTAPLPAVGEDAAHERLAAFATHANDYAATRNLPGRDGTSKLSTALRFGVLHPRQVLHATLAHADGSDTYTAEIAWRDFYADIVWHQPHSLREPLQASMSALEVDTDAAAIERFRTWARGETGYPLVDAGMRQLLAEGWMHNRVRMVAASFLVKHLHLDWRWGARWFMWHLFDGDGASNQQGWQWVAGTGSDAAPFHRVFNPTLQAERFDPDGAYVRHYVSELAATPAPQCLQPGGGSGLLRPAGYPEPMIDAATERNEALRRYHATRETR